MDSVNARGARRRFSELLDEAARGKSTIITRHDRAIARIVPARDERPKKLPNLKAFRARIVVKGRPLSREVIETRERERY